MDLHTLIRMQLSCIASQDILMILILEAGLLSINDTFFATSDLRFPVRRYPRQPVREERSNTEIMDAPSLERRAC